MKDVFDSVILGIVQGATEFIPVSSSGHLVVVHEMLGATSGTLLFDILLHIGTLCAVCLYFWTDVKALVISCYRTILFKALKHERDFVIMIMIATVPAVSAGLFFGDIIENLFRGSSSVAVALILGSALMWGAEWFVKKQSIEKDVTLLCALGIGLFQALALVPGISRSGSTISGGMILGLNREKAVRLSFLLSIPVIFGATLSGLFGLNSSNTFSIFSLVAGLISSFGVGLLAIHFLITYLKKRTMSLFIWYRVILAVIILILL